MGAKTRVWELVDRAGLTRPGLVDVRAVASHVEAASSVYTRPTQARAVTGSVHFGAGFAGWLAQAADRWPPIDT